MRYISKSVYLFVLWFSTVAVVAQIPLEEIDQYIEESRSQFEVPGMAVAIVKDGEIIHAQGYGTLSSETRKNVDAHTLFAIASNTKAFISSAIGVLVDQGRLDWDDRVIDHLPYFRMYDAYVTQHITVRDLLCHRSGLGTFSGDVIWYKSELPASEIVRKIEYVPQAYDFRSGYGYSNLMFITAGEVIRAVTDKPWDEYVEETFFNPLEMKRTITSVDELDSKGNYALPHKTMDEKAVPIAWVNWDNMGAAGGIISSVSDMANWLKFNLQAKSSILSVSSRDQIWTPHNNYVVSERSRQTIPGRNFNGYGLGWGLFDYYGRKVITHSGGYDGMYSRVALVPEENLGFVVLTNSMTSITSAMLYYLLNAFIEEDTRDWTGYYHEQYLQGKERYSKRIASIVENRIPDTEPTVSMGSMTGTYFDPMYGEISVTSEGEELKLSFSHAPDLSAGLKHWHYDTWEIDWDQTHAWFDFGTLRFTKNNEHQISGIEFDVPNYDIFFHEIHAEKQ